MLKNNLSNIFFLGNSQKLMSQKRVEISHSQKLMSQKTFKFFPSFAKINVAKINVAKINGFRVDIDDMTSPSKFGEVK